MLIVISQPIDGWIGSKSWKVRIEETPVAREEYPADVLVKDPILGYFDWLPRQK